MALVRCANCGQDGHPTWGCPKPKRQAPPAAEPPRVAVKPVAKPPKAAAEAVSAPKRRRKAAQVYAPPGQCVFCDRRRARARDAMRRLRKATKGNE